MGAVDADCILLWDAAEDLLENIAGEVKSLRGNTVVVTGSTGLIGSQLVRALLVANENLDLGMSVILPVRDVPRANAIFEAHGSVTCIRWSLGDPLKLPGPCDLFVHAAGATSSRVFSEKPVETILEIIEGTSSCLYAAHANDCSAFVHLSTMEVYGEPAVKPTRESDLGSIDPAEPRNSYPIAKLASESLVCSFAVEHSMRTTVLRLAQTFGAGARLDDGRVFAEFARCAMKGEDIVLLSDGSKRNCYLAVDDAVSAILTVLISGEASGIYNVANPDTYCSILEMARMVLREFGLPEAKVIFGSDPTRVKTFRRGDDIQLDVLRILGLGWKPTQDLRDMYRQLLNAWGV